MKKQNLIRKNALTCFGFGVKAMKNLSVCSSCSSMEPSYRIHCSKCGSRLPETSLYDLYKSYHISCSKCGTVLSPTMHYCPHCGTRVHPPEETGLVI